MRSRAQMASDVRPGLDGAPIDQGDICPDTGGYPRKAGHILQTAMRLAVPKAIEEAR